MNKLNTSGERLKHVRGLLGISRSTLEEVHGISHNTMSAWEIGRIPLSLKGAEKLSKIFIKLGVMCSTDWLLCKTHERPYFIQDKMLGPELNDASLCVLREVEAFKTINPKPIVMMVSDDGMLPNYEPGHYVGGNIKSGALIQRLIGTNCIIQTYSGDIHFRRLLPGQTDSTFTLSCLNLNTIEQPVIPNVKVINAAQVIWHRSIEVQD